MRVDITVKPEEQVKRITRGLRNGLTLDDNLQCSILDIPDSGPANTALTVAHNLGKVPEAYMWNISANGVVYDSNRAGWTNVSMEIKCSVANAALKLIVF